MTDKTNRSALQAQDVRYGYERDGMVLRGVTLGFERGMLTGILGPNGSGKSSFLKALARILPYEGKIFLDDVDIHAMHRRDYAKRLAMVGQFNDCLLYTSRCV